MYHHLGTWFVSVGPLLEYRKRQFINHVEEHILLLVRFTFLRREMILWVETLRPYFVPPSTFFYITNSPHCLVRTSSSFVHTYTLPVHPRCSSNTSISQFLQKSGDLCLPFTCLPYEFLCQE